MSRSLSLAHLTYAPLGPEAAIALAAELGCASIGLRIAPAMPGGDFAPLIADKAALAAMKRALAASGVSAFDVEIIRLTPAFSLAAVEPFLSCCGELGARAMLVAGDDPETGRLVDNFGSLAAAAAPYGLTADLEFMPWATVGDCRTALAVVEASGAPNGRVLVDALHAARSATTLADIESLPRSRIGYAQICDAPPEIPTTVEGLLHTARQERLLPGDGGIDLAGLFAALPGDVPVSIEIPNARRRTELGVAGWARLAVQRSRALLEGIEGRRRNGH